MLFITSNSIKFLLCLFKYKYFKIKRQILNFYGDIFNIIKKIKLKIVVAEKLNLL